MNNWEELVQKVAELLTTREKYQRVLGQIAYEINKEYGAKGLQDFAVEVKDTHGISVSPSSLRNYEYTYRQTKDLNLPDDMSYRTLQYIASSGKPEYWAERIEKEGLSSPEVYRLIRQDKGMEDKKTMTICPYCYKSF